MTIHGDLAGGAREAHAHFFGSSVLLCEPGQADREITAKLHELRTETRRDVDGRENRVTLRWADLVDVDDVRHDAIVTVGVELYSIDQVGDRQAGGLRVQLMRVQRHATERSGYRR